MSNYMNIENLCRVCLQDGATISLFDQSPIDAASEIIACKLSQCVGEKIEDKSGYPNKICESCNQNVNNIILFLNLYKSSCEVLNNSVIIKLKQENDWDHQIGTEIEMEWDVKVKEESQDETPLNFTLEKTNLDNSMIKTDSIVKKKILVRKNVKSKLIKTDSEKRSVLERILTLDDEKCSNDIKELEYKEKTVKTKKTKPEPFKELCSLCGEIFTKAGLLQLHVSRVHEQIEFNCPQCWLKFFSQELLERHILRRHSNNEKKIPCPNCDKLFIFKKDLTNHLSNVHVKKKKKKICKCQYCDKEYACMKSVLMHERAVHTGERPAVCDICGVSFTHDDYLKEHVRLHTGETPFKCPVCNRGYAQRGNMKSHIRHIHKLSELTATQKSTIKQMYLRLMRP